MLLQRHKLVYLFKKMEEWQKQHITQSLPKLIVETDYNVVVKAGLLANNIITQTDVEELEAENDRKGKTAANFKLYERLVTRVGAYGILLKILEDNKQTGVASILKNGVRNLGIPKELNGFNDVEIDVQGKTLKLHELFFHENLELMQQIFQETLSEVEFYDAFVTKQKPFVLATSNIPHKPPFYVPRFVSNRIEIDEPIFKADFHDVFVFKNTIERYKLSEIAKPNFTASSRSQLTHITCRFIYLDDYEDWIDLKKSAQTPIHLINYEADREIYILEDTSGALDILSKIGSKNQRPYLSEDEFIQQKLSENLKTSSVCICDTPGMGKTFLLANIARLMKTHCAGTIVAFIQLSTFAADFYCSSESNILDQEISLLNIFKCVSSDPKNAQLLLELVKTELLRVEIFFDGFDEIPTDKVEWMKQIFVFIKNKLPYVRIYITSRPHMRHELERTLDVIAYDILPFNIQNQVDYLVQVWSSNVPLLDKISLQNYALRCLKEVNKTLTRNEKKKLLESLFCVI